MSEEMEELGKQLHDDCVGQTGVDEAFITTVKDHKGFPDDEKFKCYLKCLMTEMAVVGDDGVIDVEAAVGILPDDIKDKAEPVMRKCGAKVGANPCDHVYLTHKCYYDTDPETYMIV
uniref:Pheromone-binding protein n=1 Tax=Brachysternus prasinus TaxID=1298932 RepID=M1T4J0_9SCAR|nr:pheromone-binding protein [Brachysternus prasinus]